MLMIRSPQKRRPKGIDGWFQTHGYIKVHSGTPVVESYRKANMASTPLQCEDSHSPVLPHVFPFRTTEHALFTFGLQLFMAEVETTKPGFETNASGFPVVSSKNRRTPLPFVYIYIYPVVIGSL